mgnify:CR=1 FL=1
MRARDVYRSSTDRERANRSPSQGEEETDESSEVAHHLGGAELGLSVDAVDEGDWNLAHGVSTPLGANDDFHLKHVPFRGDLRD